MERLLASFTTLPSHCSARINPLTSNGTLLLQELCDSGLTPTRVDWYQDALLFPFEQRQQLVNSTAAADGRIYIQNLSSMLAALLLDVRPGQQVLDLAAAPGGKTLILAAQLGGEGWLSAVEPVRDRFYRLKRTLSRCGAEWVHTYQRDGIAVGRLVGERFDRVLLDAPCSTEARFHSSDPATFAYWGEKKIAAMARKQRKLIESAFAALRPGGQLLYSTCSFAPEENEAVVSHLLERSNGTASLITPELPVDHWQAGLTSWRNQQFDHSLNATRRILPGHACEGFFLALIRKG